MADMQIPLQITFRSLIKTPEMEDEVREGVAKLEQFFDKITGCRVVVEAHHRHHRKGRIFHVRIDLTVPGGEIIVSRDPEDHAHEDVYLAIRDAFHAAQRRLQDYVRRVQGIVKTHEEPPRGRVARLFPDDDYGFLTTSDGREVYFHRHSLLDGDFDRLQPGDEVWFAEEIGERGPQASTVHVAEHRHGGAG